MVHDLVPELCRDLPVISDKIFRTKHLAEFFGESESGAKALASLAHFHLLLVALAHALVLLAHMAAEGARA